MKNEVFIVIMMFVISALITSCDENKELLKRQVEQFSKECPASYGDILTINSVAYNKDVVEMDYIFNENFVSISAFNSHKEEVKEVLGLSLSRKKLLLLNMVNAKAGFRAIIGGGQSGMKTHIDMSPNELKRIQEKYMFMSDAQKTIEVSVIGAKMHLPLRIDQITTLSNLFSSPSGVIYNYEINDKETGKELHSSLFSSLMKNITMSQMTQSLNNGIMGTRNRQFYQALIDCNQGVKVNYIEKNTGNKTSFQITTSEIRDIMTGKYQKDALSMDEWRKFGETVNELERIYDNNYSEEYVDSDIY